MIKCFSFLEFKEILTGAHIIVIGNKCLLTFVHKITSVIGLVVVFKRSNINFNYSWIIFVLQTEIECLF